MLSPKKVKYRKQQKGKMRGIWPAGPRLRQYQCQTDRGRANRDDPPHQEGRQNLDSYIPGQTLY